eukprot:Plantae.Rhodophyta-Hildenbrandia_rubra.ctg16840.p1 GENE.Plantae.Rhodophyta-Hildenbrandia_rubra.ctg16840~~Plantae.Rhodophyta-Hildenbrandia_rubra.ctg16840.p1  ORF type:complete len:444 (-),score=61.76 Plantae.Rhodophyta-Hildenbrandia_rubra.ctg16840:107-1438(-)
MVPTLAPYKPAGPILALFNQRKQVTLDYDFLRGYVTAPLKYGQIKPGVIVLNKPAPLPQLSLPLPCEAIVPCYLNGLTVASLASPKLENGSLPLITLNSVGLEQLTFENVTEMQIGESLVSLGDSNGDGAQEIAFTSRITPGFPGALFTASFDSRCKATQLAKIDLLPLLGPTFQVVDPTELAYFKDPQGQFANPRSTLAIDLSAARQELLNVGDIDEDGIPDLFLRVGQDYYILFINSDGSLKSSTAAQTLESIIGNGFVVGATNQFDQPLFPTDMVILPDLDGDGKREMGVVGSGGDIVTQAFFITSVSKTGMFKAKARFTIEEVDAVPVVDGKKTMTSSLMLFGFAGVSADANPVLFISGISNDGSSALLKLVEFDLSGKTIAVALYSLDLCGGVLDSVVPIGDPVGDGRARLLTQATTFDQSGTSNISFELIDLNLAAA